MAAPTPERMRAFFERHVELWNAGKKDEWMTNFRDLVTGDFSLEDPVGNPPQRGFAAMSDIWDMSPNAEWKLAIEMLFVCGNELAAVISNDGAIEGQPISIKSIELYTFGDDGSLTGKVYRDVLEGGAYEEWSAQEH